MKTLAKIKFQLCALVLLAYPLSVIVMFVVVGLVSSAPAKNQGPRAEKKTISINR